MLGVKIQRELKRTKESDNMSCKESMPHNICASKYHTTGLTYVGYVKS